MFELLFSCTSLHNAALIISFVGAVRSSSLILTKKLKLKTSEILKEKNLSETQEFCLQS